MDLALVDHEGGDVTTYAADAMESEREASVGESSKYEHKVRGGGWSHLNWQRSAETIWAQNAAEVAAEIERQVRNGPEVVILAGDEHSRSLVTRHVPGTIPAELVVLDRAGRPVDGGDDALAEEVEPCALSPSSQCALSLSKGASTNSSPRIRCWWPQISGDE